MRTDRLSTNKKQGTAIARTMLHDPPGAFLDEEPTSGLDVPTARTIERAIGDAKKSGKCVLYSTHVMEEAEYLCDRIAVISDGQIENDRHDGRTARDYRHSNGCAKYFWNLLGLPE